MTKDEIRAALSQGPTREQFWRAIRDLPDPTWKYAEYVYFLHNPLSSLVKIGSSAHLRERHDALSRAAGVELHLVAVVPTGGRRLEQAFHQMFWMLRQRSEWFAYDDHVHAIVADVVSDHGLQPVHRYPNLLTATERICARNPVHMPRLDLGYFKVALGQEEMFKELVSVQDESGNLMGVWRSAGVVDKR